MAPGGHRRGRAGVGVVLALLLLGLWLPWSAWADVAGLRYEIEIAPTGHAAMDAAIERASLLASLGDDETLVPLALIARAQADRWRIDDVLRSFGYYDAVVDVQLDGCDPADPLLAETLAAGAWAADLPVKIRIDTGPLYRLAEIRVDDAVPEAVQSAVDLRVGEPAEARRVLSAGTAMLEALREDGFALAQVPPPQATVDHRTRGMAVRYSVDTGPRVALGGIEITGLERLREGFVRRRLGLAPGEPYSPSHLEQARRDLLASEAVAAARVIPATALDVDGRLPLAVEVVERKRRTLRVSGAFASDEGASLLLGWTHRNLFGGAERLSVHGEIGAIDGASRDSLNYAAGASLRLPDRGRRDLDLAFDLDAVSESLDAYDRDAVTAGAGLELRLSPRLAVAVGAAVERARIAQDGPAEDFRLLSLPLTLGWDGTDAPQDPRRGLRVEAQLVPVPWVQADGPGDGQAFVRADLSASAYLDLTRLGAAGETQDAAAAADDARAQGELAPAAPRSSTVIAGRLALGRIIGADARAVPADWRLYAGGAGSVRGYPYQSIGPRRASNAPAGGDSLLEGSLELRRRLRGPWGMVAFADAGSVTADGLSDLGAVRVGVGLGVRFHTVIGPLRADVAVPLDPYPGDAPVQLYLGIGEAF